MIELVHVTKLYQEVIGVNDLNLSLPQGAYGLLGPNGAGKSTLLNLLTGQLVPTMGRVRVLECSPRNNARLLSRIGYCPGTDGLYADVSALEWVGYLQQLHGLPRPAASAAAESALERVGLQEAMHRPIATYSRGMRQRTKLAQAIAHDPDLLILDEPFNGLDPIGRHEMTAVLRTWIERGKSLLLASHVLHEIEAVTRSFLLISGGRLLASGTAEEVHRLFVDLPNEITIHCDHPHRLAEFVARERWAERLSIDGQAVAVSTRHPSQLLAALPAWANAEAVEITEIHSAHESLAALFNSLMKMHRGEV